MSPVDRDRSLRVRVSDEELAMLHALADETGLSASDIVRQMVRERFKATFGDKKPKPNS